MNKMCWMSPSGTDSETKILHLKVGDSPWRPYTSYPQFAVGDYSVPRGSKGYATFQKLLKAGWEIVPSPQTSAAIDAYEATKEEYSEVYRRLADS
jgi:hypothetical protein